MKYCSNCGEQLNDDAVICPRCGCATGSPNPAYKTSNTSTLKTIALVFMILGCIAYAMFIIPLLWTVPMTIKYNRSIKEGTSVSIGFKVCTFLFVNLIAGILMLCDNEN